MTSKNYQIFNPSESKVAALAAAGVTSGLPMVLKFKGLATGGYKSPLNLVMWKVINQ